MERDYTTLATIFLAEHRATFNFVEWNLDGQIPHDYHFSLPIWGDAIDSEKIIPQIFTTAEREIGWNFMVDGVIFKPNLRENFGVDRVDLVLHRSRKAANHEIDFEKIHLSEENIWKALHTFMEARKIDDMIYLEANTSSIILWRLKKGFSEVIKSEASKSDSNSDIKVSNVKVDWQDIENKTKNETFKRMHKFLTSSAAEKEIKDTWANLMFSPKLHYESVLAKDLLRADLTANLNSMRKSAPYSFNDFGAVPGKKSVVICTGDIAVSLENAYLVLALIDGLGLYGNIQLLIDKRDIFHSLIPANIENEGTLSANIEKLIDNKFTLISAQPIGNGDQDETVLAGLVQNDFERKEVYGLRNRIHTINIEDTSTLTVQPIKVKDIGGVDGGLVHQGLTGKIILDTRDRDEVFYGPEPRNNLKKVNLWISGLRS